MLDADEHQEMKNTARRLAGIADVMWAELSKTAIPDEVAEQMFVEWWKVLVTPRIEMPDFSKIFKPEGND